MDRSCIIVEVALYPPDDKERKVLLSDFSLRIDGTNTAVKPSAAKVVAANWQQQFRMQQDVKTELDGEVTLGPSVVHLEGQVRFEKGDSPAQPRPRKTRPLWRPNLQTRAYPRTKPPRQLRVTSTSRSCRGKHIRLFSWIMKQTEAASFLNFPSLRTSRKTVGL